MAHNKYQQFEQLKWKIILSCELHQMNKWIIIYGNWQINGKCYKFNIISPCKRTK